MSEENDAFGINPPPPTEEPKSEPVPLPRGLTLNAELQSRALDSLRGKWGTAVGAAAILIALSLTGQIPFIGFFISLLIGGPLALGGVFVYLGLARNENVQVSKIFDGFDKFSTAFPLYLLVMLFTILWTLLLIVPGIIKGLSYSMSFFILADNPEIGAMNALKKSQEMMMGYKMKLFCLYWRFFGWAILCVLTLFIGCLWLSPYIYTSMAHFYEDIRPKESKV